MWLWCQSALQLETMLTISLRPSSRRISMAMATSRVCPWGCQESMRTGVSKVWKPWVMSLPWGAMS